MCRTKLIFFFFQAWYIILPFEAGRLNNMSAHSFIEAKNIFHFGFSNFVNFVSSCHFSSFSFLRSFKTVLEHGVHPKLLLRISSLTKFMWYLCHKLVITRWCVFWKNTYCSAADLLAWLKQVCKQLVLAKNDCYCPVSADSSLHTKHGSECQMLWW